MPWEMVAVSKSVLTVQAPSGVSAISDIDCRLMARTVRLYNVVHTSYVHRVYSVQPTKEILDVMRRNRGK